MDCLKLERIKHDLFLMIVTIIFVRYAVGLGPETPTAQPTIVVPPGRQTETSRGKKARGLMTTLL